jgi:hypothetical protein
MHTTTPTRRALAAVLTAALALGAAACGDDDEAEDATTTTEADADATTTTAAATDEPAVVDITAEDYRFVGLDAPVDAGSRLHLANASDAELHELVAFRLPDDETRSADELIALGEDGLNAIFQGPPATVIVAPPGISGFPVVGDGTLDEPGRYLVLCSIPTGADPEAYLAAAQESQGGPVDVPGGPPHLVNGMYGELEVVG